MDKIEIGHTAGKVWHLLDGEGELTVKEIQQRLNLTEPLLYLALGWLCRENKIECCQQDGVFLLSKNIATGFFG